MRSNFRCAKIAKSQSLGAIASAMKSSIRSALLSLGIFLPFVSLVGPRDASAASANVCETVMEINADEAREVIGDFEITVDPEDPNSNLILTANIREDQIYGTPVGVMRLDGVTGLLKGRPRIIAVNYFGEKRINGPEFLYHPDHGLGISYYGPDGVHGAWRRPGDKWAAFDYDLFGAQFPKKNPPALPGTRPDSYPTGSPAYGVTTRIEFSSGCYGGCAGNLTDQTFTEFGLALVDLGVAGKTRTMHPVLDGYVIAYGCNYPVTSESQCALLEVKVDGVGGLQADTLFQLTPGTPIGERSTMKGMQLRSVVHPATQDLYVVLLRSNDGLEIWKSSGNHAPLTLAAAFSELPDDISHLRVVEGDNDLFIQYVIRTKTPEGGTYVTRVDESGEISYPEKISDKHKGTELVYLPAAKRLAFYYDEETSDSGNSSALYRCWVNRN